MTVNNIIVSFNFHIFSCAAVVTFSAIVFLRMQNYTRILFSSMLAGCSIFHFLAINFMAAQKSVDTRASADEKKIAIIRLLGNFMYLSIYELRIFILRLRQQSDCYFIWLFHWKCVNIVLRHLI